jgi:hypothetical protein
MGATVIIHRRVVIRAVAWPAPHDHPFRPSAILPSPPVRLNYGSPDARVRR